MMRLLVPAGMLLALTVSCSSDPDLPVDRTPGGGEGGDGGDDTSTTADDSGDPGTCATYGFGGFETRTLPPLPGIGPWRATSDGLCGADGEHLYRMEDVDGDGFRDVIMVRDCAKQDGTGDDHWVVFPGTAAGWSEEPVRWSLPASSVPYGWNLFESRSCEGTSQTVHGILDVTGDGRNDFVIFDACDDTSSVGRGTWVVHAGTDEGFVVEGETWEVATPGIAGNFNTSARKDCMGGATPRYEVLDVNGDAVKDLLLTGDCGANEGLGSDHWLMYPGTGSGFRLDSPVRLDLPQLGSDLPLTGAMRCASPTDIVYGFADHDQDGDKDLLISGFCDGRAEPGTSRWDVYVYEDDALASTPSVYPMPDIGVEQAWMRNPAQRCSGERRVSHAFWDVNGDGYWDAVVREMCVEGAPAGLGTDHYRLWLRNPDLSLGSEQRFELPLDPEGTLWLDMLDDFCGHVGDAIVTVTDLDGDETPDALLTYGCDPDASVGWTEWKVAAGGCVDGSR